MPDYGKGTPPPPRSMAEVKAVLAGAPSPAAKTRPIHIVLVASKKDHGPGEHDYPAWQTVWQKLLATAADVKATTVMDWPTDEDFKKADVLVFYQKGKWTAERAKTVDAYLRGAAAWSASTGPFMAGPTRRALPSGSAWRGGRKHRSTVTERWNLASRVGNAIRSHAISTR